MLALDLGPSNVTGPGRFESNMTSTVVADEERYQREAAMVPLGRWGKVSELSAIAVFLASPAAAYVTGMTMVVDGGLMLQHPINLGIE